jgi:MFS family permease
MPRAILNADLRLLILSMSLRRTVLGCLQVIRALYLYIIGYDLLAIGLLSMVSTAVGALRSVSVGLLADKYGRKGFIVLGGMFSTIRLLIYAFSTDYTMLIIAQIIGAMGEGAGAGQPSVSGLIADKSRKESRTRVFTVFALTNSFAGILGSLLGGLPKPLQSWLLIGEVDSFRLLFMLCSVLSFISIIFVLPLKEEPARIPSERGETSLFPKKSTATISKFSFVRAIGGFGFGITGDLIGPWFKIRFSLGEEVLSPIYAASRFIVMFLYLLIFKVVEELDEVRIIALNRTVSAVTMLLFPFVPGYLWFSLLLVVYRVSITITMPIRQSFIVSIVDPSERASAVGFSNLARMSFRSIAPAIGGYIMQNLSMSLPFMIGALVVALNGIAYKLFFGKKRT